LGTLSAGQSPSLCVDSFPSPAEVVYPPVKERVSA
jgi:hypothetical protein